MTTDVPSGGFARARTRFRHWRRARPFWGGLLTLLAGLEIFATTQGSLGGLSFQMGPTGFLSWLIPVILVTCGLLMWFSPQQRMFYAIVAAVTAVFSLIGVNLGGFLLGLLLGMVGSGLGFAWTPVPKAPPEATEADTDAPAADEPVAADEPPARATMEELFTGPLTDTLPPARNPLPGPHSTTESHPQVRPAGRHPVPEQPTAVPPTVPAPRTGTIYPARSARPAHLGDVPAPGGAERGNGERPAEQSGPDGGPPRRGGPGLLAITLVLLSLSAVGLVTLRDATPAMAAPCPTPSAPAAAPGPTATGTPATTPTPAPGAPADKPDGGIIGAIVDGVNDLLGIGKEAAPTAGATPTPTATPSACPTPTPSQSPAPAKAKKARADPDQPAVARFSRITGSKITMFSLKLDGVAEVPSGTGKMKVLKFQMNWAVTDDFEMRSPTGDGRTLVTKSKKLTIRIDDKKETPGKVIFYATKFKARFWGFIPMELTPEKTLLPNGVPFPLDIPLDFYDPEIDLIFVDSQELIATKLVQTLA